MKMRARLFLSVALMAVSVSFAVQAQDAAPAKTPEQIAAEQLAAAKAAEAAKQPRKETYFLGPVPDAKRQLGPAIGAPRSILPQPFVPVGSVTAPPPEAMPDGGDEAAAGQAMPNPTDELFDSLTTGATGNPAGDALADEPYATDEPYAEGVLDSLDPSGVAVLTGDAALARDFWAGYSRAEVEATLTRLASSASSPAGRLVATRALLSGMMLEKPAADADIEKFLDTRLTLLQSLGDAEGYGALIDRLPKDRDWLGLARHITNAHLIRGRLAEACALSEAVRLNDSNPYWVRMAAFCRAARGDRAGVDFQLGILEEVSDINQSFYQLLDQILVEAEQQAGAVVPAAVALENPLKVDLLEATMARLAKVTVQQLVLDNANPLAVGMVLALPNVARPARADLMGQAVAEGWVTGRQFADYVRATAPTAEEMQAALIAPDTDTSFLIDASLAHAAAQGSWTDRQAALTLAWVRVRRRGMLLAEAAGFDQLMADVPVAPDQAALAPLMVRAGLVADGGARGKDWFRLMRTTSPAISPTTSPATGVADAGPLTATWPLLRVAVGADAPAATLPRLEAWWRAQDGQEARFERANLLFTLLEALGDTVPEAAWGWLENGAAQMQATVPSAALWRKLLLAQAQGNRPDVLATSLRLMAEGGPAGVSSPLAGSLVAALKAAGFEAEARAFAAEMLVAQGL